MRLTTMGVFLAVALGATAGEWKGFEDSNWISGPKIKPGDLRRKVVLVAEWGMDAAAECAESLAFAQKNALGQKANGHPVVFICSHRQGGDLEKIRAAAASLKLAGPVYQAAEYSEAPGGDKYPGFYVVDAMGAVRYGGTDRNDAVVAMVNALTDMPAPGQLIDPALSLKKLRNLPKKLRMGQNVEGAALAPVRAMLKSKKPGEAEEAQSVIDSIERAKKNLEDEIKDDLAENDKGAALRDIRWFCTTWPSQKQKYAEDFKRLQADPEAVKAEKAWFESRKQRRRK